MNPLRPAVQRFALAIEAAMARNEHKPDWHDEGHGAILAKLDEEVAEVHQELTRPHDPARIQSEAADVGAVVCMLWDMASPSPTSNRGRNP
jgi:NTP pyrophosphatase (non-canonical NTP hydrolase)